MIKGWNRSSPTRKVRAHPVPIHGTPPPCNYRISANYRYAGLLSAPRLSFPTRSKRTRTAYPRRPVGPHNFNTAARPPRRREKDRPSKCPTAIRQRYGAGTVKGTARSRQNARNPAVSRNGCSPTAAAGERRDVSGRLLRFLRADSLLPHFVWSPLRPAPTRPGRTGPPGRGREAAEGREAAGAARSFCLPPAEPPPPPARRNGQTKRGRGEGRGEGRCRRRRGAGSRARLGPGWAREGPREGRAALGRRAAACLFLLLFLLLLILLPPPPIVRPADGERPPAPGQHGAGTRRDTHGRRNARPPLPVQPRPAAPLPPRRLLLFIIGAGWEWETPLPTRSRAPTGSASAPCPPPSAPRRAP